MAKPNAQDNMRVNALLDAERPELPLADQSLAGLGQLREQWTGFEACPVLCADRDAGLDQSWPGWDVRTYLRGEQSAGRLSVHSVVLAPGAGIAAHYHDECETFVMVLDGQPEIQVGSLVEMADRYSFAYAPARTRFGIRNPTTQPAWFNLVYQKAGNERAFACAHQHHLDSSEEDDAAYVAILAKFGFRFDSMSLPNDMLTNTPVEPLSFEFSREGDLEHLRELLSQLKPYPRLIHTPAAEIAVAETKLDGPESGFRRRLLSGDEAGGSAMLNFVASIPPAPRHYQPTEDELFFIMDGELEMTCGNADVVVSKGAMAYVAQNCTHGFRPPAEGVKHKFITFNTPGGHEHAMAALRSRIKEGIGDREMRELSAAGGFIFH